MKRSDIRDFRLGVFIYMAAILGVTALFFSCFFAILFFILTKPHH